MSECYVRFSPGAAHIFVVCTLLCLFEHVCDNVNMDVAHAWTACIFPVCVCS